MKLKRIEISGFKSFSSKEVLYFEHPITAIVGPNGSGKSNAREALSFVLGEQSIKHLRGKKTEDLIFNGSSLLPRLNRASVKIVFDNTDRSIARAFDEIEIERTIHRDSSNHYYINGSSVRKKDIHELLSQARIGTGSHHTISQGEADKALSLAPRDRRTLVEESLGLSYFQGQKREALLRLERTRENMREAHIRKREHTPHLKHLEREMNAIQKLRALKTELSEKLCTYVPAQKKFFEKEEHRISQELSDIDDQIQHTETKLHDTDAQTSSEQNKTLESDIQNISRRKAEVLRALGKYEAQLETHSSNTNADNPPISHQDACALVERAREDLQELSNMTDIDHIQKKINALLQAIESTLESTGSTEEPHTREISDQIHSLQHELETIESQESEVEQQRIALRAQQENKEKQQSEQEEHTRQLKTLTSIRSRLIEQRNQLKERKQRFERDIETWAFSIGSSQFLQAEVPTKTQEKIDLADLERDVHKITSQIESMSVGNADEIQREYEKAKTHADFLEYEIQDLEETTVKLQDVIERLTKKINETFTDGLDRINAQFDHFFKKMFAGGAAQLIETERKRTKTDGSVEYEKGIDITVTLEHKRISSLSMLSGGERTLVSIALIFALTSATAPPFLILDETDAALDESNSKRYGDLISELAQTSQLILITHNRETMARAGRLYGITMGKKAHSELLSIDLSEARDLVS